jgi:hypothetical protein
VPCTQTIVCRRAATVGVEDAVQARPGQGWVPSQGHRERRLRWKPVLSAGSAGEEGLIRQREKAM